MKKLLVILLLLGTFITESEAKVQAGVGITVGPAFGKWNNYLLKAKLSSAGGTLGFQTGVHAGIQARVWFNKFIGLNLAAEFNMSGNRFTSLTGSNSSITFKLLHKENQLTVPLTAMVGWGNERLRIFGNFGAYFGYNINGTEKISTSNNGSEPIVTSMKSNYDSAYNSIDVGARVGAGIQVYVDKKLKSCVTFDINYDYGFLKTFRNGTPAYFSNPDKIKITGSKLVIGVGFIYTFGKSQAEEKPKRVTDAPVEE